MILDFLLLLTPLPIPCTTFTTKHFFMFEDFGVNLKIIRKKEIVNLATNWQSSIRA